MPVSRTIKGKPVNVLGFKYFKGKTLYKTGWKKKKGKWFEVWVDDKGKKHEFGGDY